MRALFALAGLGILTLWAPERWVLGAYQCGAFLLAAMWLARTALDRKAPLVWHPALPVPALIAVLGLVQIATGVTVRQWATVESVLSWTANAALFFVAAQALADRESRGRYLDAMLCFGTGLALLSTLQLFTSGGLIFWLFPSGYSDGVLGPFVYRNQYAAFIETVLPVALYRGLGGRHRLVWRAAAAIMTASVVAGASRAGTLLVFAEVVAVLVLAARTGRIGKRAFWMACGQVALAGAIAIAVVGWSPLWKRMQTSDAYGVRREMLLSSIEMVRDRPLAGFGLGAWPAAYPRYARFDDGQFVNQAHNDWAQWAVECGVPMLLAMLFFAVALARPALDSVWGAGILFLLAHCLVDYPLQQRPQLAGWFFVLAGAVAARSRDRDRSLQ